MQHVDDRLTHLLDEAGLASAQPLWTVMDAMVSPQPRPKAVPHVWRWSQMRPMLERAGVLVGAEEAERRVLMLVNPAMRAPYTSDTLYAGLQLVNPGETARAHRHTAFALRFVIEGERGFTAVGGERVTMGRGDVVLTPRWTYHDHGHDGAGPIVWLDGLDLPLFQALPLNFAERYEADRFPSVPAGPSSALRFAWSDMRARLDASATAYATESYTAPSGAALSSAIGASAERIAADATSERRRETASSVYHVVEGVGRSRIGDRTIAWERGDTFVVPAWMPYEHLAIGPATTYLFRFDDRPLLDALGCYRSEEG